jgi:hypothetical protein
VNRKQEAEEDFFTSGLGMQSPLVACCASGFADGVSLLLAAGATCTDTLFCYACKQFSSDPGQVACIEALVADGANVDALESHGDSKWPIMFHALHDGTRRAAALVKLLSSLGASSVRPADEFRFPTEAEDFVITRDYAAPPGTHAGYLMTEDRLHLYEWLVRSRRWTTCLHHVNVIPPQSAHALLRDHKPILTARASLDPVDDDVELLPPSLLELAQAAEEAGTAAVGSTARLILTYHRLRKWRTVALAAGRLIALRMRVANELYAPDGRGYDASRSSFELTSKRQRMA